jgi:hypothetical protein
MRTLRTIRGGLAAALAALFVLTVAGAALGAGKADIPAVRAATNKYKDINAAFADGYAIFYQCTEEPGVGTMGQHLLNGGLLDTPEVDALRPEVLVYEPTRSGGWKLVAVEYVTFQAGQTVLGQGMNTVPVGNRYGVPVEFYAKHAWIWHGNPRGIFADWNPTITCLGTGDNGGTT